MQDLTLLFSTEFFFIKAADVYGKLPLHYVADRVEPNLKVILCLLAAYPQGERMHYYKTEFFPSCVVSELW